MEYYILLPGDNEKDASNEANLLGESSFDIFWAGSGLGTLMKIVMEQPELLPDVRIIGDDGKSLTVTKFLDSIQKLKVRTK